MDESVDRRRKRADDGLRTRDLQLGKLALYQLSYVRVGGYSSMLGVALERFLKRLDPLDLANHGQLSALRFFLAGR